MDQTALEKMSNIDLNKAVLEDLADINDVEVDMTLSLEEKVEKFACEIKNPYLHRNKDYVVQVKFADTDYSATDALKHYLSQVAELKY